MPLILETHPDVWAIVPDPVRLKSPVARPVLHVGQLRAVQRAAYFKPVARRRVFILDRVETMRWDHANIFLKILEEPPETATLDSADDESVLRCCRRSVRGACSSFSPRCKPSGWSRFSAIARRSPRAERKLAAQLAEGSPGEARVARFGGSDRAETRWSCAFWQARPRAVPSRICLRRPRSLRRGKECRLKPCSNCSIVYSPTCWSFPPVAHEPRLRNPIFGKELASLSRRVDPVWVAHAVQGLDELSGPAAAKYQQATGPGRGGDVARPGPLIQKSWAHSPGTA